MHTQIFVQSVPTLACLYRGNKGRNTIIMTAKMSKVSLDKRVKREQSQLLGNKIVWNTKTINGPSGARWEGKEF